MRSEWISILSLTLAMGLVGQFFYRSDTGFYRPMIPCGYLRTNDCCERFFSFFVKNCQGSVYRKGDFKYLLFMAVCEPCLYFIFEARAIENTTASQAGMITAMLPLMVAVGAHLFLKERVMKQTIAGFVLAILGACWLSMGSSPSHDAPNPLFGNFCEFMAMVFATGYTITLKRLTARYNHCFSQLFSCDGHSIFSALLFFGPTTLPTRFDWVPSLAIVYLGVFITFGAYGLYNYGVSRIPASQASSFVNLIPVFTIVMGWLVLGERFTASQYLASGLVFVGVFISQERKRSTEVSVDAEPKAVAARPDDAMKGTP
jgi:drug/metabolite transporter (DMT)-like permease